MLSWLKRRLRPKSSPLTGAPLRPRVKTYAAAGGWVYEYLFRGHRAQAQAAEFVFTIWSHQKPGASLSIVLSDAFTHGLDQREIYGVAKLVLFAILDDDEQFSAPRQILVSESDVLRFREELGLS